jgi:4-oxalocrotonate tautomerase
MPIISIKIAKGRTTEQKRMIAKAITDSVVSILDVKPEWVSVLFEEYDRENWSTGGELHIDKFGAGCGKAVSK